jgi:DNA-binding NarL/FixJ family response regulator
MNFLVVEDHGLVREALRAVLRQLDPEAVVMEASNCAHAVRLLDDKTEVELVLLDLILPDERPRPDRGASQAATVSSVRYILRRLRSRDGQPRLQVRRAGLYSQICR